MIIYIDVLLFVNFFIDVLLISLTGLSVGVRLTLKRLILSALVAALFSLYIFLPAKGLIFELIIRLLSSAVTVLVAFGFHNVKRYLRALFSFYAVSFLFAGAIMGLKLAFPNSKVQVNNGAVYFDISPVLLIVLSFVIYLVIFIVRKFTSKTAVSAMRYKLKITVGEESAECVGMADSGHSLKDAFGESMVFIIDKKIALRLFGSANCECLLSLIPPEGALQSRFRLIPVKTVSGERMLPGVRCDMLEIYDTGGCMLSREKYPIAVIAESGLGDDFSAILPVILK